MQIPPTRAELNEAIMQACAWRHEIHEAGSTGGLGPVGLSLNLPTTSSPTRSPFAVLEATTVPRPGQEQFEFVERSSTNFCELSTGNAAPGGAVLVLSKPRLACRTGLAETFHSSWFQSARKKQTSSAEVSSGAKGDTTALIASAQKLAQGATVHKPVPVSCRPSCSSKRRT